jgi:hypothetical protein
VKQIERRPRIAPVVPDTEPAIIVSGVQNKGETIMNLGDKLVRLRGDQSKGLQSSTVGSLPRVPDASEGEGSGSNW